ncbi:MAG TPA: hypothetical protein VFU49_21730 [Ktedonobacteraceae bacterium]|nr:hypothetical protein [Ktedonobacteraceae bacterium]
MPKDDSSPISEGREDDFPSLDLLFELIKDRIAVQRWRASDFDSKANFLLGAGTALMSAALLLQSVLLQTRPQAAMFPFCPLLIHQSLRLLPLLVLLVVYLATMLCAFFAYIVREYKYAPDLGELYNRSLKREERSTKLEALRDLIDVYKENDKIINNKRFWTRTAFIAFGGEVTVLVLVLLVQTAC